MKAIAPDNLHTHRFYRINGRVLFCVRYIWHANKPGEETIDFEGISPEDYAAYITHRVIGENQEPYRSVGEMESIPLPEPVKIQFSASAKVESLSKEDALRKREPEQEEQSLERWKDIRAAASVALSHLNWMDRVGALTDEEMPMLEGLRKAFGQG